jgi:hypothetical protein
LSGKVDPNAARVAINAYQWLAMKLVPTVFGERQEVQVTHQHLHLHALRQLSEAAKVGQAAIAQRELELQAIEIGDTIGDSSDDDLQPIEIIAPRADDVSL